MCALTTCLAGTIRLWVVVESSSEITFAKCKAIVKINKYKNEEPIPLHGSHIRKPQSEKRKNLIKEMLDSELAHFFHLFFFFFLS